MSSTTAPKSASTLVNALPYLYSLLLLFVIGYLFSPPHLALKDMPEFYAPGRMLLSGNPADLYRPEALYAFERQTFPGHEAPTFYIPPYGLPLLAPLGLLPAPMADPVWFVLLVLCSFGGVVVLKLTLGLQHKHVMRIAALLCASGMQWEAIRNGQLSSILLLGLSIAFFLFSRQCTNEIAKGKNDKLSLLDSDALAALALTPMAVKPQLIVPLVVALIGAGRYKVVALLSAILVALNGIALAIFGKDTFSSYFALLSLGTKSKIWQEDMTPTVRGQFMRLLPGVDPALVSLTVFVLGLVCIFCIAWKYKRSKFWWEYLALSVMPISFPTALHAYVYDWLLLLPTVMVFAFGNVAKSLPKKKKLLWLLLPILPVTMPLYNKILYEYYLVGGKINFLFWDVAIVAVAVSVWLLFRHTETNDCADGAEGIAS